MNKNVTTSVFTLVFAVAFSLLPTAAFCEVFEYRHTAGSMYRFISVVEQSVFINGVLSHTSEILSRISAEITEVRNGNAVIRATYQNSERTIYDSQQPTTAAEVGFLWSREYDTEFERDRLGSLTVGLQYFMPNVRNVPLFPGRSLNVGDRWHLPGHEIHDFSDAFGIMEPYRFDFNAFYEYEGDRPWENVLYPTFAINYNIDTRPAQVRGRFYPTRINGRYNTRLFWDRANGREKASESTYEVTYTMSDGRVILFRSRARAELVEAQEMNREQIITEITNEINRLAIRDVTVREVDEGISISLDDIQFYPDSSRMLPGEQAKLDRIAEILRRYPDRDIQVSGHTALAGTAAGRMSLSQERAREVAGYLISQGVRSADRVVIRGFGAERPVADNTTEEGMRRNRRVEIILLEN